MAMLHRLRWILEGQTTPVDENADGSTTLANGGTYYAELGGGADEARLGSVGHQWSSLVGTIDIEVTNDPEAPVGVATSGSAWSAQGATQLTPAGSASGRSDFANATALRYRAKLVVGATSTKATLDLDGAGLTTHVDTIVRAKVGGTGGNSIRVRLVADGTGTGQLIDEGNNIVAFHFQTAVTTVANFETAIAGSALIEVGTAGTGANVLTSAADQIPPTFLTGGAGDGGNIESYSTWKS